MRALAALLPDSATVVGDALHVGGCDLEHLAQEFGTPLYVYDVDTLRNVAREVLEAFSPLRARVSFAAKACALIAVLRTFLEAGLDIDVVSHGEMEAAGRAGFRPAQVHLHGNFKTDDELRIAISNGIHAVVADDVEELQRLSHIATVLRAHVRVQLRIRLPMEAETHPHLQTSGQSSKFGIQPGEVVALGSRRDDYPSIEIIGIHAHMGSQIAEASIYGRATMELARVAESLRDAGLPLQEIGVGGGWAVAYAPGDPALSAGAVAQQIGDELAEHPWARPAVEPGRALVARSAVALYRVGSVKSSPKGRIVAVDGGMGDNPRPALYGSRYHAFLPSRPEEDSAGRADVVGRYCESGDVLARDVPLPTVSAGELLCIPVAGAYQLSMASAYNLVPPPAAVMVRNGDARLIMRRATLDDLFAREMLP